MRHRSTLLLLAGIALAGCGVIAEARLVGVWKTSVFGLEAEYVFRADGTVTITSTGFEDEPEVSNGTWSADATTLTIDWGGGDTVTCLYELTGDVLILTPVGGLAIPISLTRA